MADVRDIQMNFTANTSQAEAAIQRLKGSTDQAAGSLDKQAKSTVNANGAVVSFGRIIQDAPFGIIGVANNITMLSEQFVSLKQQAGSTGAALQAMKAGVFGPMGISIGISLATSALMAFTMWSGKAKAAVNSIGEAMKDIVKLKNPLEGYLALTGVDQLKGVILSEKEKLKKDRSELFGIKRGSSGLSTADYYTQGGSGAADAIKSLETRKIELEKSVAASEMVIKELEATVLKQEMLQIAAKRLDPYFKFKNDKANLDETTGDPGKVTIERIKQETEKQKSYYELLKNEIQMTLQIDNLLGRKTGNNVYTSYLEIIGQEIQSGKLSQSELLEWLRLRKEVLSEMEEDQGEKWASFKSFDKFRGFVGANIKGMKSQEKEDIKNKLKADQAAAKAQYAVYKDYFIDPFTEAFKGEFSKAWQSIFGEANSLLEKFIQSLGESLFNKAVGSAASGILGMIFPGFNLLEAAVGGGGGDRSTVNQIIMDGELIATQKQANRTQAIINRQNALR